MIMGVSETESGEGPAAYQRLCGFEEPTHGVLVIPQCGLPCQVTFDVSHRAGQHVRIVTHGVEFRAGHD
jgi:hypothetical protein